RLKKTILKNPVYPVLNSPGQPFNYFVKEPHAFDVGLLADAFIVAVIASAKFARRRDERREAVAQHAQVAEIMAVGEAGQDRIRDDRLGITLFAGGDDGFDQIGVGRRGVGLE